MAKLFGQFLIEENQIDEGQLLLALIVQLRSSPSTGEVIFESDLLSKSDQLRILEHQQIHGSDYRGSARELDLWSVELFQRVSSAIQSSRTPLGEILVSLGYITGDNLSKYLNTYVQGSFNQIEQKTEALGPKVASIDPVGITDATLDPVLSSQYADSLKTRMIPALRKLASEASFSKKEEFDRFLLKFLSEIVAIRSAAQFISAQRSLTLADDLISTIKVIKQCRTLPPTSDFIDMIKFSMHLFDGLSQLIAELNSEADASSDANLSDLFERIKNLRESLHRYANVDDLV